MIEYDIDRTELKGIADEFLLGLLKLRAGETSEYCQRAFQAIPGLHLTKTIPGGAEGEYSMEFSWSGFGKAKPIFFHAWMDDIPQPVGTKGEPEIRNGYIYGPGAAAGKSGVAVLYGLMWELCKLHIRFPFDVKIHLSIGQRRGGKGCAALLAGEEGQAAVLMEPTGRSLVTRHVGCLWLKLVSTGVACHTSVVQEKGAGKNAMVAMFDLLEALEALHAKYAAEAAEDSDLKSYFNLGSFHAGIWVGAPAPRVEAAVAITLVPSKHTETFLKELDRLVEESGVQAEVIQERACGGAKELPEVFADLLPCLHRDRFSGWVSGSDVPMDLGTYSDVAGIPAVAFGACDPAVVATDREKISEKALLDSVDVFLNWLKKVGEK